MTEKQQQGILKHISSLKSPFNPYISRLLAFFLNNPLYKGVLIIGSGTALAQIIGIVAMPIITRIYTPSDLGILAVYSSVLAIVGTGASLRYEFAYLLPKEDEDAVNLLGLCLILILITATMLAIVLFFWGELITDIFDLGSIEQYLWFILVGFVGVGLYAILNNWAIRQRDYKQITYTKINQGIGGAATKIIFGLLSFGSTGLILGHIVSQIAGIGTLARAMWKKEMAQLKAISLSRMGVVAKAYKSFPTFNLPASVLNTASLQIAPIMLLALYDSQVAGFYALANAILILPGTVISQSMGQVYLGEASKMVRENSRELRLMYLRTLRHLTIIAVPLIGIPAICAPFVFPFIFGEAWTEAGWYCLPLALMVISSFVVSPTSKLLLYGYNHWVLFYNIILIVGIFIGFYISKYLLFPALITLLIYAIVRIIMNFFNISLNLKAIHDLN